LLRVNRTRMARIFLERLFVVLWRCAHHVSARLRNFFFFFFFQECIQPTISTTVLYQFTVCIWLGRYEDDWMLEHDCGYQGLLTENIWSQQPCYSSFLVTLLLSSRQAYILERGCCS
jgi:hypothetical protein